MRNKRPTSGAARCTVRVLAGVLTALSAGGCTVGPNYQTPQVDVPARWSAAAAPGTLPAALDPWWTAFGDPELTRLMDQAVAANLDVQMARARVREARARRAAAAAEFWPQAGFQGGYQYLNRSSNRRPAGAADSAARQLRERVVSATVQELTDDPFSAQDVVREVATDTVTDALTRDESTGRGLRTQNLFEVGFDASWEVDVFGGLRRNAEAATAAADAAEEELHEVLLTLLFEVARNYIDALGFAQRATVARQTIVSLEATVRLTQARYEGGLASGLDVAQAQAELASTRAELALHEAAFRQAVHQLSVLLGRFPDEALAQTFERTPLPAPPPEIPLGLPSDLLRRRPDIRRHERELAAATARIGAAEADFFPRFSLTGSFGSESTDVRHGLDRRSLLWSVGPAVSWPILEFGRLSAKVEEQEALEAEALAGYRRVVLQAVREVEDALVAFGSERTRHEQLTAAVGANQRAVELATLQYQEGVSDFLDVLDSQRSLRLAEDQLVQSRTALALHAIGVFKTLGGGWNCYVGAGDQVR